MNSDAKSKLPLPSEVSDFRFLRSDKAPGYAVLELATATNPVRVFLSREQIERLATEARITASKLTK
jgi:hypothetical protein